MDFIKEGLPHKAEQPGFRVGKESAAPGMGDIEVQETDSGLPPDLEEAAVLYANGKVGEAAAQINRYLLDHPDNLDPEPWFMLFDLYEASDQKEHFDDAAVDFAVRFEVSPPTWSPRAQLKSDQKLTQPLFSFGKEFSHLEQAKLTRFTADALQLTGLRLDFTNTPLPDEEYTRAILQCLVQLQDGQRYIKPIGTQNLVNKLKAARADNSLTEPGWLLLLALLQLLGQEKEFEDSAVDYAVRFEMSPPTYTPPAPPVSGGETRGASAHNGFTFSFFDVIGPGSEPQFNALGHFAEELPRVEIDLSQVTRVDFAYVGLLLDTLINLTAGGRTILIKEGNELVNTLLQVIGANHFATIVGRTRG